MFSIFRICSWWNLLIVGQERLFHFHPLTTACFLPQDTTSQVSKETESLRVTSSQMYNTLSSYAVLEFHFMMLAYNVMAICKCCVVLILTQFAVSLITNARDFQLFFPLRLGYQVVTPLIRFLRPCMRRRAERQWIWGLWHCLVIFFLLFKNLPHRRPTSGND